MLPTQISLLNSPTRSTLMQNAVRSQTVTAVDRWAIGHTYTCLSEVVIEIHVMQILQCVQTLWHGVHQTAVRQVGHQACHKAGWIACMDAFHGLFSLISRQCIDVQAGMHAAPFECSAAIS